jgi:hypothetical protein
MRFIAMLLFAGFTGWVGYLTYYGVGAADTDTDRSIRQASAGNPVIGRVK